MRERTQGDKSHAELLLHVQRTHILLHQPTTARNSRLPQPLFGQAQHLRRAIHARHLKACLSQWQQQTPAAASQFEQRTSGQLREVQIHIQVFIKVRVLDIVKVSYRIVIIHSRYPGY